MTLTRLLIPRSTRADRARLLRSLCGCAIGLVVLGAPTVEALAQSYMRTGYGRMNRMGMAQRPGMADEEGEDDLDDDGETEAGDRETPKMPKTDLARAIMQQDVTREPRSVLAARAKLAGRAREEALKPVTAPEAKAGAGTGTDAKGGAAAEEGAGADVGDGMSADTPLMPGERGPGAAMPTREELMAAMPADMPPEMRAMVMAQMEEMLKNGGVAGAGEAGDASDVGDMGDMAEPGDMGDGEMGDAGDVGDTGGEEGDAAGAGAGVAAPGEGASAGSGAGSGAGASAAQGAAGVSKPKDSAAEAARKKREKAEKTRKQAEHFRLLVVAGEWPKVGEFLKTDAGEDAELVYEWMLTMLASMDSALVPDEVISISEACPSEMNDKIVVKLGALLKATQRRGCQAGAVAARISQGTAHFGGLDPVKRKRAAGLLVAAGLPVQAQTYLPPLEQARRDRDVELLNLYAVYFSALAREKTGEERERAIEQGWQVSLEALGIETAPTRERTKAVDRALRLIGETPADTGDRWLKELLSSESDAGWEAIERVNRKVQNLRMRGGTPEKRLAGLKLIQRIGRAILSADASVLARWQTGLNMLTLTILEEAEMTRQMGSAGRRPSPYGYDEYGGDDGQMKPIDAATLGQVLPDAAWLRAIDPGLAAKLELMAAATAGGAGDTQAVLDMIRPIVSTDPERAKKLAESLLQAWPNFVRQGAQQQPEDMYGYGGYGGYGRGYGYGGYGYGYGGGGGIPLTRAKQQRNLEKLRDAVRDLRSLAIGDLPPNALVEAFAASYSMAEVYTREHIELVFGELDDVDASTRLKIAEKMRTQLAGAWRSPQVQEQAGTKRTNEEMNAQVLRGYELAHELAGAGEETWERLTLQGDLFYDQAEFTYGATQDGAAYDELRGQAFGQYAQAAQMYRTALLAGKAKPTARVFVQWFSAALGASDLGYLTRQDRPDLDQVDDVRRAIEAFGDSQNEKHLGLFAQQSLAAMGRMAPELKPKYLKQAVRIIGAHPEGKLARERLAYYDDLNTEVALAVFVDGSTKVGTNEPFGVHFGVRCTRAVARETGGFSKYLMNEQWNPMTGQPVNYKDEVEKMIRERWGAQFDVVSVNFHKPMTPTMSAGREGWEFAPLAYVMMKAKDAKTDRIPDLKLDMDFADSGGLVILPVVSDTVAIDARERGEAPALKDLSVEQVFDDREAAQGVVRLEVRATGKGLMPSFEKLFAGDFGGELRVRESEDHGVNVVELDTTTGKTIPVTERTWTITLEPKDTARGAERFAFSAIASGFAKDAKLTTKRYTDADVADAPTTIAVAGLGPRGSSGWMWWILGGVVMPCFAAAWVFTRRKRAGTAAVEKPQFTVPENVTPMGALSILRRMSALNGALLRPDQQRELDQEIAGLERAFFSPQEASAKPGEPELRATVARWVTEANRR